jgi:hypothetical protein
VIAKNDVTGDELRTKAPTQAYSDGWDRIFKKEESKRLWEHYCKHNGHFRVGTGESCSWCGEKEDGSLD